MDQELLHAGDHRLQQGQKFFDDLTGQPLDPELVKAARAKELAYFENKEVWKLVPTAEALKVSGKKPISVRWVDVNNGGR